MPGWTRRTLLESRVPVGTEIPADGHHSLNLDFQIPADCGPSSPWCAITLNALADIRGQIDPSGNANLQVQAH
jgi:hypothetical protein